MKTMAVVLIAFLSGLQIAKRSTEKKPESPYRAESSAYVIHGKDAWTYVTENRSFRFAEVLGDNGNYETVLLLEETYHNERTDSVEGVRGRPHRKLGRWSVVASVSYGGHSMKLATKERLKVVSFA